MHAKVEAGAQFFITQPIYALDQRDRLLEAYESPSIRPLGAPVFWGIQVLDKDGIILGDVPGTVRAELEHGRPGADIAADLLTAFTEVGVDGIYMVPPIIRGGARDYQAAQHVLSAIGR